MPVLPAAAEDTAEKVPFEPDCITMRLAGARQRGGVAVGVELGRGLMVTGGVLAAVVVADKDEVVVEDSELVEEAELVMEAEGEPEGVIEVDALVVLVCDGVGDPECEGVVAADLERELVAGGETERVEDTVGACVWLSVTPTV